MAVTRGQSPLDLTLPAPIPAHTAEGIISLPLV